MYQSHESQIFLCVNTDIASLNSSLQNQLVIKKPFFLLSWQSLNGTWLFSVWPWWALSFPRSVNQFQCPNYSAGSCFSRLDATLRRSGKTTLLKPFPQKWSLKQMPSEKSERKWEEGKRPRGRGAGREGRFGDDRMGAKIKTSKSPWNKN